MVAAHTYGHHTGGSAESIICDACGRVAWVDRPIHQAGIAKLVVTCNPHTIAMTIIIIIVVVVIVMTTMGHEHAVHAGSCDGHDFGPAAISELV